MARATTALLLVLAAAAQESIQVTTLTDPQPVEGRFVGMAPGPALRVLLPAGGEKRVPAAEVVMATFPRTPAPRGSLVFTLAGGDRIYGTLLAGGEDTLRLGSGLTDPLTVPLDALRRLEAAARLAALAEPPDLSPAAGADVVLRRARRGVDRIVGTLEALKPREVLVATELGKHHVPLADVVAVILAPTPSPPPPKGLQAVLLGAEGSRLRGRLVGGDAQALQVATAYASTLRVPVARLAAFYFTGGACVFLSDLEPTAVVERSYFPGLVWPYRRDRTTTGRRLRLGGRYFPKGLGVHAYCSLTYALDGRYRAFRAWIGIDDEVRGLPARGAAVFRVLVDGKEVYRSPMVRGGEPPRLLPLIPLTGKRRLTLVVDFGADAHVADRADWALAYLVKAG